MSFQNSPLTFPVCKCHERQLNSLGGDQNLLVKALVSVVAIAIVILISCILFLYFGTMNLNTTTRAQLQYLDEAVNQLKKDVENIVNQQGQQNQNLHESRKLRSTRESIKKGKGRTRKKKKKNRSRCKCNKEIQMLQKSIDIKTKRSTTSQMYRHVAHLRGLVSDRPSQSLYQGVRFLWQKPETIYENNFLYERDGDKVHSIGVFTDGIYEIYSQITLHGEESGIADRECGQKLVKQSSNGGTTVLAKSFITQTEMRDRPLYASTQPLDTSFQKGYFFLEANDKVYIAKNCERNINFQPNPNSSYFGMLLINDFSSGR